MRKLAVYLNNIKAGEITEDFPGSGFTYVYDAEFLTFSTVPISFTLPLRSEPYHSEYLFPFFTNLLPEGNNKRVICRKMLIDETDYFGLLTAMADKDCIGAVQLRKLP